MQSPQVSWSTAKLATQCQFLLLFSLRSRCYVGWFAAPRLSRTSESLQPSSVTQINTNSEKLRAEQAHRSCIARARSIPNLLSSSVVPQLRSCGTFRIVENPIECWVPDKLIYGSESIRREVNSVCGRQFR